MIDRALGWLTGKLLVFAGKRAYDQDRIHDFNHIVAAMLVGNTGPGSHTEECLAETVAHAYGITPETTFE